MGEFQGLIDLIAMKALYFKTEDLGSTFTDITEKKHSPWRNTGSRFTNWCADKLLNKPPGPMCPASGV